MSDITIEGDKKAQQEFVLISFNSTKLTRKRQPIERTKGLPVKSTEDLLIGIRKPIVFFYMALLFGDYSTITNSEF
jgi:hypothetical protein